MPEARAYSHLQGIHALYATALQENLLICCFWFYLKKPSISSHRKCRNRAPFQEVLSAIVRSLMIRSLATSPSLRCRPSEVELQISTLKRRRSGCQHICCLAQQKVLNGV